MGKCRYSRSKQSLGHPHHHQAQPRPRRLLPCGLSFVSSGCTCTFPFILPHKPSWSPDLLTHFPLFQKGGGDSNELKLGYLNTSKELSVLKYKRENSSNRHNRYSPPPAVQS